MDWRKPLRPFAGKPRDPRDRGWFTRVEARNIIVGSIFLIVGGLVTWSWAALGGVAFLALGVFVLHRYRRSRYVPDDDRARPRSRHPN